SNQSAELRRVNPAFRCPRRQWAPFEGSEASQRRRPPGRRRRGATFPMTFFATSHPVRGQTFGHRLIGSGAVGVTATSHTLDVSVRGLRGLALQPNQQKRAAPGDRLNVEENAGGREPPGRNTRRCT